MKHCTKFCKSHLQINLSIWNCHYLRLRIQPCSIFEEKKTLVVFAGHFSGVFPFVKCNLKKEYFHHFFPFDLLISFIFVLFHEQTTGLFSFLFQFLTAKMFLAVLKINFFVVCCQLLSFCFLIVLESLLISVSRILRVDDDFL